MTEVRAFIAINLPVQVQNDLQKLVNDFKVVVRSGVKWEPVHKIHLTLVFLGEIDTRKIPDLTSGLEEAVKKSSPFDLKMDGVGAFPNASHARVIWAGLQPCPALSQLQMDIYKTVVSLGFEVEKRPFSAHLTVGRVYQDAPPDTLQWIGKFIQNNKKLTCDPFPIDSVHLLRSELKPGGSVYSSLASFALNKQ